MSDYDEFVKRMGSFDMELSLDDIGPNKDELKHHGILGMKWGVRRFQNKDGTLTPAGKKRYNQDIRTNLSKKIGMKWGVRRFQNKDGTLTPAGEKRYNQDIRTNLSKKKSSRIDTSKPDPKRWVKEDIERKKKITDASSKLVTQLQNIEKETRSEPAKQKMDLSKMTDKELRDRINREHLEKQYNDLFAPENASNISKGREFVKNTLDVAGTTLALTGSALSIALAIKELKG